MQIYVEPWVKPTTHPIVVLARSEPSGTEHAASAHRERYALQHVAVPVVGIDADECEGPSAVVQKFLHHCHQVVQGTSEPKPH